MYQLIVFSKKGIPLRNEICKTTDHIRDLLDQYRRSAIDYNVLDKITCSEVDKKWYVNNGFVTQ